MWSGWKNTFFQSRLRYISFPFCKWQFRWLFVNMARILNQRFRQKPAWFHSLSTNKQIDLTWNIFQGTMLCIYWIINDTVTLRLIQFFVLFCFILSWYLNFLCSIVLMTTLSPTDSCTVSSFLTTYSVFYLL